MGITFRHGKFMKVVSQMTKGCEHCCTAELGPFLTHNAKEGVRILRVREPNEDKISNGRGTDQGCKIHLPSLDYPGGLSNQSV